MIAPASSVPLHASWPAFGREIRTRRRNWVGANQTNLAFTVRHMGCWHRTPKISQSTYVPKKIPLYSQSHASLCPSFLFTNTIPATQFCVSLHSADLDSRDPSRSYGGTNLEIIKGWLRAHSASMHAILSHALVKPSWTPAVSVDRLLNVYMIGSITNNSMKEAAEDGSTLRWEALRLRDYFPIGYWNVWWK